MRCFYKDNAIEIGGVLRSSRLGIFNLHKSVKLETVETCPACLNQLTTIAVLIGKGSHITIRVGVCSECGYMGYQDKPTLSWLKTFYSDHWDKDFMRTIAQMKSDVNLQKGGVKGSRHCAFELHRKLQIDKNKPYFEIGSGYGQVMKNFEIAGFKKLYGIENSKHRAELVNKVFGFKIFHGDFGNPDMTKEIKKYGPYGLIFSHHVLEHVYDPEQVIQTMSEIQKDGDYAIFAIPDAYGEHINYLSLYWPHIHGFTKESLEKLFNRHGYEMIEDESPNILNIVMAFRKTKNPKSKIAHKNNYIEEARNRFVIGLGLDKISSIKLHTVKWEQTITEQDTVEISRIKGGLIRWYIMQFVSFIKSKIFKRFTAYYVMLIRQSRKISNNDCIEIQFEKDIMFLIK